MHLHELHQLVELLLPSIRATLQPHPPPSVPIESQTFQRIDAILRHDVTFEVIRLALIQHPYAQTGVVDWHVRVSVLDFVSAKFGESLLPQVGG